MSAPYYKGRVALVTGASSGIGAAVAETLVKEGLTVIGASRRIDRLEALSEKLKKETGRLVPKMLDVCKDEEIVALYQWAEKALGGIDVVVNNAGVVHLSPFHKLTTEQMKSTLDTNLLAVAVSSREAIKSMARRNVKDGFILNMNSVMGQSAADPRAIGYGIYPASKFGVTALTKTLRYAVSEAGLQARVTSMNPGMTKSEFTEDYINNGLVQHYLEPADVAKAVSFVLNLPVNVEVPDMTIVPKGAFKSN